MTKHLSPACAEVLAQCQANSDDLAALLDPEQGFAPRLSKLCQQKLAELIEMGDEINYSPEMVASLRLESNTWDLLQALLSERKTERPPVPKARELLSQNPYTPTATLAQSIMHNSRMLNELVVVREWLHDIAPQPVYLEATTGYWKFTKLRLLQGQRTGNKKEVEPLIEELDPDAVNRSEGGKGLSADDSTYEKALAQALYSYVRAGRLHDAIELCRKTHRSWRAASIRGSLLFEWRALSSKFGGEDTMEDAESIGSWSGNKRRKLWKTSCTRAALNPQLSEPDRALYASLAPSPATSVVLKSACRTWEDHLWAHISILCEGKQAEEMSRLNGGYWEGGMDAVRNQADRDAMSTEADEREDLEWEKDAIASLEPLASVGVSEGPPSNEPFHVTQLHIILNRTDKLLEEFASGLQTGEFNPDQENFPTLTRFFAHLCLFLQLIDIPVPFNALQVILEVYIQILEDSGQREHVAMYASALGDKAIERYALFLTSLDVTSDLTERRNALRRAEQHGLDMVRVAQLTAEKTMEKAFERLPRLKATLPSVLTRDTGLGNDEWFLIRSIEWTTFMEETYAQALEQANAIMRYFLASGKVAAAKLLLSMLPPELRSLKDEEERRTEFYHYSQFFGIWDSLDRVTESQATELAHTTKGARSTWQNSLKGLINEAYDKIVDLLTSDWLINDDEAAATTPQRRNMLVRIRQIFIPEFIIRLHVLLVNTSEQVEGHIKRALELANIVADSRYRLYDDMLEGGDRLNDYLLAVRQAVLKGLEAGGSDPFRVLTA